MKNKYYFKTSEFGVSDDGIHLLRSGFNYKTINFSQLNEIEIDRGKELHNWFVIFLIGATLLFFGASLSWRIIDMVIRGDSTLRSARSIFVLLIPVVGGYFVYTSFQTGLVLRINYDRDKKDMFPLKEIIKENKLNEFKSFMKNKLDFKFKVRA